MQPPPPHNNNITYYENHACCRPWINFKSVLLATYLPTRGFKRWLSPIRYARVRVYVLDCSCTYSCPLTELTWVPLARCPTMGACAHSSSITRGCVSLALLHSNHSSHVCMVRACVLLQITSLDEWLDIFDSPMTLSLSAEQCYPLPARPVY